MSSDERPTKIRKLSHDFGGPSLKSALSNAAPSVDGDGFSDGVSSSEKNEGRKLNASKAEDQRSGSHAAVVSVPRSDVGATSVHTLSKNQQKKLRKKLEWEAGRDDRKAIRKDKLLAKRERRKLARQSETTPVAPREFVHRKQLPVTIILDCDFEQYMRDGERISLASQVTRSYSDNKNARFRAHLTVSSFGAHLKDRFEGLLDGMYKKWRGVRFLDGDFVEAAEQAKQWMAGTEGGVLEGAFDKYNKDHHQSIERLQELGEVVYLSAEAEETLEELKPFSTYIIGGLVDKNREKGLCHRRAIERGIRTARLPIGQYLDMSSRKVLTTNHVNEIMLKWLETADWGEAFIKVIPKRKGGQLKHDTDDDEAEILGEAEKGNAEANQADDLRAEPTSDGVGSTANNEVAS